MRTASRVTALCAGTVLALAGVVLDRVLVAYDRFSYGPHAPVVRRVLPWTRTRLVVPFLPLLVPVGWSLAVPAATGSWVGAAVCLGAAAAGAELYSVGLHREAWIAAFEPWHLPPDGAPLGGPPPRPDDRRLHHLVQVQLVHVGPLLVAALLVPAGDLVPALATSLFALKFFAHGHTDYEVFYHWHLHCRVLQVRGRPWVSRAVEAATVWLLGPLHGYVPHVYRAEHLLVHHPENSGPDDLHSPLPYDRSRFLEFGAFVAAATPVLLLGARLVTHRRSRPGTRRLLLAGVAAEWLAVGTLLATGRLLGWWLLIAALHRVVTATRSQYVWHALVDPTRPRDPMASTLLWVPSSDLSPGILGGTTGGAVVATVPVPGTDWAFYDNHHLLHHLHPRAHYSEYPELIARRLPDIVAVGAVVLDLERMDSFPYDCWTGDTDRLLAAFVLPAGGEDRERLLRERLAPDPGCRSRTAALAEHPLGLAADRALRPLLRLLRPGG